MTYSARPFLQAFLSFPILNGTALIAEKFACLHKPGPGLADIPDTADPGILPLFENAANRDIAQTRNPQELMLGCFV